VLIDTAARLFGEQGYAETSLREVANGAQVTPAMVAYYFKAKPGLLEAVTLSGLETLVAALEAAVDDESDEAFAPRFIRIYLSTINENPWIPQILIREVVSRDTPLRQLFIDQFASRALKIVPPKVMAEIESGRMRHDLDPRYTLLSLVGMCLFPYLAQPVLGPLLGYQFDEAFGEQCTNHVLKLFLDGAAGARP
jgi:AcrR family transcriptional regulator